MATVTAPGGVKVVVPESKVPGLLALGWSRASEATKSTSTRKPRAKSTEK